MIRKIKHFLCRHKQKSWYKEKPSTFAALNGERRYLICDKCGKKISSYFAEYEGNGFK